MPTYEFRCPDGTIIERMFRISEVPEQIPVPDGSGMATRIISGGASLLFRGSGFYITDYGKDGKKDQRAAAGGEGRSSEGSSGASSSESKASGDSRSGGDSKSGGDPKSGGDSRSGGDSKSGGDAKSGGDSRSGGDSKSGGDAKSGGDSKATGAAKSGPTTPAAKSE